MNSYLNSNKNWLNHNFKRTINNRIEWAGRRGLMDSTLGSGDKVRGFKSRSWQSDFFLGFFLLPSSSFPTM